MKKQEIKINHSSLQLPYLINESLQYSGMDALEFCRNKDFFKNYPNKVSYAYNSRGFRDDEWPTKNKLKDCIWCLGDSFTVGLGQPIEEIWSNVLQQKTNTRTINISMDGASNTWIARKAIYILKEISPSTIVIQWTFQNRREMNDTTLPDNKRRLHISNIDSHADRLDTMADINDFIKCFLEVETNKGNTEVVHTFIPGWTDVRYTQVTEYDGFWNLLVNYNKLKSVNVAVDSTQLDFARDSFHYGLETSTRYTKDIMKLLQL